MNTLIIATENQPMEWPEAAVWIAIMAVVAFQFYCMSK
jgi:hypothetical protein